jgi:myosin heavy chain 6/7
LNVTFVSQELQQQAEEENRQKEEARESYNMAERRCTVLGGEVEELRTALEQAERARKASENELTDANDRVNELSAQAASLSGQKRKLEADINAMQTDFDDMNNELKASDDRSKKAMGDAARLADELRAEQEHGMQIEKLRKNLENQMKDLQLRLDEAESQALKGGKKMIQKLEVRVSGHVCIFKAKNPKTNIYHYGILVNELRSIDRMDRAIIYIMINNVV